MTDAPADSLVGKIVLSGVIAAIVGGVAAFSGIGIALVLIAMLLAVGSFWLLDSVFARSSALPVADGVPRSAGPLPATATQPLAPPRGVEPPTIGEPLRHDDVEETSPVAAQLDPNLFEANSVEIKSNAHGKSRVFSIRIAKHGNTIDECEDAVAVDPRRAVVAVADGASSSFGAHLWAAALTQQFVKAPPKPLSVGSFATWLGEARTNLMAKATSEAAGNGEQSGGWWSEQGAREGAYSTIVGAAIMTDGEARVATVMCLGDSSAFVLTGAPGERAVRRSLPYEDATQFGAHPSLLSSMPDRLHDEPSWTTVPTAAGNLLVLASDAVAEWLLAEPRRFQMFDEAEPEAIANRLLTERTGGHIVNDDLTVAVLELTP